MIKRNIYNNTIGKKLCQLVFSRALSSRSLRVPLFQVKSGPLKPKSTRLQSKRHSKPLTSPVVELPASLFFMRMKHGIEVASYASRKVMLRMDVVEFVPKVLPTSFLGAPIHYRERPRIPRPGINL